EPRATEVLVSTNALFSPQFEPIVAKRRRCRLVVEEQRSEEETPGALGALLVTARDPPADEPLLVVAGDNVYGFPLARFLEGARANAAPTVAAKLLADKQLASSFGVIELAGGTRVAAFHEKPEDPPSSLVATALYLYPPGWAELFAAYERAARASPRPRAMLDAPGRILEWAVAHGRAVHAWVFEEPWYDVGSLAGYLDALQGTLGPRHVEGHLVDCVEGPGVYVFGDARATGSRLEQVVLLPGAVVERSRLTRCIVDARARVVNAALADSLIGSHDTIVGA
ncbi:MAG: sugar phosphate nucleotidyltransferase, partial [bacterium]